MRFLFVFIVITAPFIVLAGEQSFSYYAGTLDEKVPIQLHLWETDSEVGFGVAGRCIKTHDGTITDLAGTAKVGGSITLSEIALGQKTGTFQGQFSEDGRLVGTWTSPDDSKARTFATMRFGYQHMGAHYIRVEEQPIEVSLAYPVFEFLGAAKEQALNGLVSESVRLCTKGFMDVFSKDIAPGFPTFVGPYTLDIVADVPSFALDRFASVHFVVEKYMGGAHGVTEIGALNVVMTGESTNLIELDDLVDAKGVMVLSDLCIADLRRQGASSVDFGMVTSFEKDDLADFTLSPRGITIYFEPYAVASYGEGTFEATIPFDLVTDILKRGALKGTGLLND